MSVITDPNRTFALHVPIIVAGGGGCGLSAAIAARDLGVDVLVLERDATPLGSTAMSTGLIPAAGTPEQLAAGIADDGARFAADIIEKSAGTDKALAWRVADESAETIAWLQAHGLPLTLVEGFVYPGHSVRRMFGTPNRTGGELMAGLLRAGEDAGATILCDAVVETLFVDESKRVLGVAFRRPDGAIEEAGCDALILGTCGFGGDATMVRRWLPDIGDAPYHGHPANMGDAVRWGEALSAQMADMDAYQGHGNVLAGHGLVLNWPSIILGGLQVNLKGKRFYDETIGYSAAAAQVNRQPRGLAWTIFDERIAGTLTQFDDYREAVSAGAIVEAPDIETLAKLTRLPFFALSETMRAVADYAAGKERDPFGRFFTSAPPLSPPFRAARVTGALFHTQGGLSVDVDARVLRTDGTPFPNLFAGGGAARGVSGGGAKGYIAGNGLLTATTLGKLAGRAAARQSRS